MLAREHWLPYNWIRVSSYIIFLRYDYRCWYTSAHPYKRKTLRKGDTDVEIGVVDDSTSCGIQKKAVSDGWTNSRTCRVRGGVETQPSAWGVATLEHRVKSDFVTKTLIKAQLFYSQMLLYSVRSGVAPIVISYLSLETFPSGSSDSVHLWKPHANTKTLKCAFLFNCIDFYKLVDLKTVTACPTLSSFYLWSALNNMKRW